MVAVLPVLVLLSPGRLGAQSLEERVTSLLRQMTLEEKILQLHQEGGFNTADNLRLGIPGFIMADGPHGVRDGLATSFPVRIGMAATWDTSIARLVGIGMGEEFRAKGKHQALGPCLDIDRDPRNGRSPESGGEDPYLCGQITAALVQGIQSTPCIATIKHYNANHREDGRMSNNITASQRVLHDEAGLAFRTAVQQGGALSVMNAYTLINSQKCAENFNLLTMILKMQWGFPYYVVSDWGSIWDAGRAIRAGCDVCMGSTIYETSLPSLVASGAVSEALIDEAVRRVLRTKLVAGMLDYQPPGDASTLNSVAHQQLCLNAGRKSIVLLRNQGSILPLNSASIGNIALIGPNAAVAQTDGAGSSWVSPFYSISPKAGIEEKVGTGRVMYAKGCDINSADTSGFVSARAAAALSDVVVYCGGLDASQEGEGFDRVGGSIQLPGKQQDLINALAAVNPNVIVVLFSGGVCGIERCAGSIHALVQAFYPGQEGGRAVADVLFGDYNPAGRLPVTMPVNDAQLPPWLMNDNFDTGYGRGYRWFERNGYTPQFPFGFGLSYTTFSYDRIAVAPATIQPGELVTVSVDVRNTGARAGEEVVQLYLSDSSASPSEPLKQLKGFRRVALQPGETKTVTFTLTADEEYAYDETSASYQVRPGMYVVRVGGSSADLPLAGTFSVLDGQKKPDLLVANVRVVPPYPFPGQPVVFLASVRNLGSAAVQPGVSIPVSFRVNGEVVSWSNTFSSGIPAGGMALISSDGGPTGSATWTPSVTGAFQVTATVDPDQVIDEAVESNNARTIISSTVARPADNLALNKPVSASSVEKAGLEAVNAVDGNLSTRWSSAFSDPQSITVDLEHSCTVDDVTLYWESAYARDYLVQRSSDSYSWTDIVHETNGNGGIVKIPVQAEARYIRMIGQQRATSWGYSLYELQVHGTSATNVPGDVARAASFTLAPNYPNPFNPSTTIGFSVDKTGQASVQVFDLLGRKVATLFNGAAVAGRTYRLMFDAQNLAAGIYVVRLDAGSQQAMRRMVLVK